jgi:hypothetical protein
MDNQGPSANHLQQSLSQLHDLLAGTPRVDESATQLLREVLGDIERLLANAGRREGAAVGTAGTGAPEASAGIPAARAGAPAAVVGAPAMSQSRLEALAVEFEADHPALAASLREFIELLAGAGL